MAKYNINCNNNNNKLINKSNVKFHLNRNNKRTNLRNISHSNKCMMIFIHNNNLNHSFKYIRETKNFNNNSLHIFPNNNNNKKQKINKNKDNKNNFFLPFYYSE